MNCPKCSKPISENSKFCEFCGEKIKKEETTSYNEDSTNNNDKFSWVFRNLKAIISIGVVVFILVLGAYYSVDDEALQQNKEGLEILDKSNNYDEAIEKFESVADATMTTEDRINVLINTALAYEGKEDYQNALIKYKESLSLADEGTFIYYIILGSIADIEDKPEVALLNYNKAFEINPDDYQLLTMLGVFYLDEYIVSESLSDLSKALEYNKKADDLDGTETTKENLALTYLYLEEYDKAIELFLETSLESKPNNNLYLGVTYLLVGNETRARIYLEKAHNMGVELDQEYLDFINNN